MDIKDRVMGDQPDDFLHKIAGIVPGYHGYVDRERRRDADKILRTTLARQFTAQRERLTRVQQSLLRDGHLEEIAEIDRLAGALQRFIDRLSVATYGYAGLFDPIKVEAEDLDQIYAFDMALTSGIDQVSSAINAIESSATSASGATSGMPELPAAITRLSSVLNELNQRLNERADLLTSGKRLANTEYNAMLGKLPPLPESISGRETSGEMARYSPGESGGSGGTPTTSFNQDASLPETQMGSRGSAGQSYAGIETASSPVDNPGAPGHNLGEGLEMASGPGTGSAVEGIDAGANLGNPERMNISQDNPKP